jgi:RNA polymerase sigma factor (sigma-70 family)
LAAVPSIGRASGVDAQAPPEAQATRDLFERYANQIFGYCMHQLGSREEAEDAVQSTFLNAFRGLQRGVVPELEQAWLFKIAHNVCLSRHRSSWRRGRIESPQDFEVVEELTAAPVRSGDELIGFQDVLEEMPENQRRAILLREWQGLSYREIAAELDLSQAAVETLIFRARRSLAQGLEQPPERKSRIARIRRSVDLGGLLGAAKTLLAGAGTVKVAATAVAVTAVVATPLERHHLTVMHHRAAPPAAAKPAAPATSSDRNALGLVTPLALGIRRQELRPRPGASAPAKPRRASSLLTGTSSPSSSSSVSGVAPVTAQAATDPAQGQAPAQPAPEQAAPVSATAAPEPQRPTEQSHADQHAAAPAEQARPKDDGAKARGDSARPVVPAPLPTAGSKDGSAARSDPQKGLAGVSGSSAGSSDGQDKKQEKKDQQPPSSTPAASTPLPPVAPAPAPSDDKKAKDNGTNKTSGRAPSSLPPSVAPEPAPAAPAPPAAAPPVVPAGARPAPAPVPPPPAAPAPAPAPAPVAPAPAPAPTSGGNGGDRGGSNGDRSNGGRVKGRDSER